MHPLLSYISGASASSSASASAYSGLFLTYHPVIAVRRSLCLLANFQETAIQNCQDKAIRALLMYAQSTHIRLDTHNAATGQYTCQTSGVYISALIAPQNAQTWLAGRGIHAERADHPVFIQAFRHLYLGKLVFARNLNHQWDLSAVTCWHLHPQFQQLLISTQFMFHQYAQSPPKYCCPAPAPASFDLLPPKGQARTPVGRWILLPDWPQAAAGSNHFHCASNLKPKHRCHPEH